MYRHDPHCIENAKIPAPPTGVGEETGIKRLLWLSSRHGLRRHLAAAVVPAQPELVRVLVPVPEQVPEPAQRGLELVPARLVLVPVPEQVLGLELELPPLVPAAQPELVLLPRR